MSTPALARGQLADFVREQLPPLSSAAPSAVSHDEDVKSDAELIAAANLNYVLHDRTSFRQNAKSSRHNIVPERRPTA